MGTNVSSSKQQSPREAPPQSHIPQQRTCDMQAASSHSPGGLSDAADLLRKLGLDEFYPAKITLCDVMAVQNRCYENESDLPWLILQKLIMLDYNGRESELNKVFSSTVKNTSKKSSNDKSILDDIFTNISMQEDCNTPNPLDVFVAIFACCDLALQQTLCQKMFMCRLAVPLISPEISDNSLVFSLWALRSIIVEWMNEDKVPIERPVVDQPVNIVTFLKVGTSTYSKSALLNNVISDQPHHTFWNRECPLGKTKKQLADGLVEAQWYLPTGKPEDALENVTMFLNLRGNSTKHKRQVALLQKISNIVVCCLDISDLDNTEVLETMKGIHDHSEKVVVVLTKNSRKKQNKKCLEGYLKCVSPSQRGNLSFIPTFTKDNVRTTEDIKTAVRKDLQSHLQNHKEMSIEMATIEARKAGISIDEDNKSCQRGKELAKGVIQNMKMEDIAICKLDILPLQGEDWHEFSKQLKLQQFGRGRDMKSTTIDEMAKIRQTQKALRKKQAKACTNLSPVMRAFIEHIKEVTDTAVAFLYLTWLTIYLDEISRKTLPGLHKQYHEKWKEHKLLNDDGRRFTGKDDEIAMLKSELAAIEKQVSDSSLGVEHLFRETAQIYEAVHEFNIETATKGFEVLPELAAKLLLKGQPLELMDGDAVNVPLTWVKAVFASLTKLVGDKKLFIISVLGIQSSGKSTLLNAMFGLQFAVSAGRCTRGVYMQLIKVDKERCDLPYDFVLVVDTEGLRAPELGHLKYDNDNQLATFVIGLGDVILFNIKGENVTEISDVLQIAVHAFLRMKVSENRFKSHRTCYFIHQNVPAINARRMLQQGTMVLQGKLDAMTKEACEMENVMDISSFNQVIRFDSETNVWYFSDLWLGDPPMAPVNPGYTERVQEVRGQLFNTLKDRGSSFLTIADASTHVQDLWKGVLAHNFVFSFRNSLAAKAYDTLEKTYHKKSWDVVSNITTWVTRTANVQLERCQTEKELDEQYSKLQSDLAKLGDDLMVKSCLELEQYIDAHNLKDIVIEWKSQKLQSLQSDTISFLKRQSQMVQDEMKNRKIELLQTDRCSGIDAEVMRRAKVFANQMKEKQTDQGELQKMFDEFWTTLVADLIPIKLSTEGNIEAIIESILYKRFPMDSPHFKKELERKSLSDTSPGSTLEGSFTIEQITESDISILSSKRPRTGKDKAGKMLQYRKTALEAIYVILYSVQFYLTDISSQQSDFQDMYANNVINIVQEGIEKQNEIHRDQISFTLLPQLRVKTIVHACRYAVKVFKNMRLEYEERHSASRKLDKKRHGAWNLFKNKVNQCTNERIASDLLLSHLEVLVTQAVKKEMTVQVVNEILQHFGFQKYNLLTRLLGDLAEGNFQNYKVFVSKTKFFGQKWITDFTNKKIFDKRSGAGSKYAMFAKVNADRLARSIDDCIRSTTEYVTGQPNPGIQTWVQQFCSTLQELPVTEEHLQQMIEQDVQNFKNLETLTTNGLQAMTERVLTPFNAETAESIKWEGETPYKQILDKLWGCEAECPFCGEVCQRTDPNHLTQQDCHQCIQHRPSGVIGSWWSKSQGELADQLTLETCNFDVQSNNRFKRGDERHFYRDYKKHEPDWDIAPSPNMESSKYWLWFMATFKHELATWHNRKVPDIPDAWHEITKQEALDSLRLYVN